MFKELAKSLISLFYPELCVACNQKQPIKDQLFCVACLFHLQPSDYHLQVENPIIDHFYGKIPIAHGSALYHFVKSGRVQSIMHNLKYRKMSFIGTELGKILGEKLKESRFYQNIDVVIPVPLHPKKHRKRGFNQSEKIADGLADSMGISVKADAIKRIVNTLSQTKLSRADRMENVKDAFQVTVNPMITDKSILLVDDVLTTGSTLAACGKALLDAGSKRIFITTIAVGDY